MAKKLLDQARDALRTKHYSSAVTTLTLLPSSAAAWPCAARWMSERAVAESACDAFFGSPPIEQVV
jgi:hypothetical protein